jgi:hypothetical protein
MSSVVNWYEKCNMPSLGETECLPAHKRSHWAAFHTAELSYSHTLTILNCCEDLRARTPNFQTSSAINI